MKTLMILCLSLASLSLFAQKITDKEAMSLAKEFKIYSSENLNQELGMLRSASCSKSGLMYSCEFTYELPADECWYGYYVAEVEYKTDHHAALVLEHARVEWTH